MLETIKKFADFKMPDSSASVRVGPLLVRSRPTKWTEGSKYGLIVAKRNFKRAVTRNRIKRMLRVWLRENSDLLSKDFDYIFIARPGILEMNYHAGLEMVRESLLKMSEKNAKL